MLVMLSLTYCLCNLLFTDSRKNIGHQIDMMLYCHLQNHQSYLHQSYLHQSYILQSYLGIRNQGCLHSFRGPGHMYQRQFQPDTLEEVVEVVVLVEHEKVRHG